MKDLQKGAIWRLLSGITAAKMSGKIAQYVSGSQKGISRDTRGAKHQPTWLTGQALETVWAEEPFRTAWIDYDSVPHTWTLGCLELCKINRTRRVFIQNSGAMEEQPGDQVQNHCTMLDPNCFFSQI